MGRRRKARGCPRAPGRSRGAGGAREADRCAPARPTPGGPNRAAGRVEVPTQWATRAPAGRAGPASILAARPPRFLCFRILDAGLAHELATRIATSGARKSSQLAAEGCLSIDAGCQPDPHRAAMACNSLCFCFSGEPLRPGEYGAEGGRGATYEKYATNRRPSSLAWATRRSARRSSASRAASR